MSNTGHKVSEKFRDAEVNGGENKNKTKQKNAHVITIAHFHLFRPNVAV